MPKSHTPVTVTEMPIVPKGGPHDRSADRIVARLADWEDAVSIARRWSANATDTFYQVRFNDGMTIATENFLHGNGGDYTERKTAAGRKMARSFAVCSVCGFTNSKHADACANA